VCQEEEEQALDDEATNELAEYERCVRAKRRQLLKRLNADAPVPVLEKMDKLNLTEASGKTTVFQKQDISEKNAESDSESDSESKTIDWSKPEAVGRESAADGSRLMPEVIELILEFFQDRPHVNRAECEEYCLKAYLWDGVGPYEAQERPLNVHTYPSENQFRNSYMVEIIDTAVTSPPL
jgi:hypothetical protein